MSERPAGLFFASILSVFFGLYSLLVGLAVVGLSDFLGDSGGVVMGLVVFALGIGYFATAYGLFGPTEWGWTVAVAVFGIDALRRVYGIVDGGMGTLALIGISLNVALLVYVVTKQDYFEEATAASPA